MTVAKAATDRRITSASTAEYFAKNLQQVGFSSPTKAVLTTLKEAVDNSLDACEDAEILPDIQVVVRRLGAGSLKNTDKLQITVVDNGPGIAVEDLGMVFGEYLASSKFGRGRCSRGQQGIGISAATTWALHTTAQGTRVITKTKSMRQAAAVVIEMDFKNNRGVIKDKKNLDWDRPHGTSVEFVIDGRVQMNGEAGIVNYLRGTVLVNPHLTLRYQLLDEPEECLERVSKEVPAIPEATEPHPHTMKLGEFLAHATLFGNAALRTWLRKGFSRLSDATLDEICKEAKLPKGLLDKNLKQVAEGEYRALFEAIQNAKLMAPSTQSVLAIGEDSLAKSIKRLGDINYFSVVSRKPAICDFKPVLVEVALARWDQPGLDPDEPVQVLRFANRVPLQFDKSGCAIVKAITTVNWRAYELKQPKDSLPLGPYIIAVSVVSPFIKFKNASKETIDASEELVEEIRRALMQAGQRLSKHLKRESRAEELENRIQHIQQFAPILVEGLCRIVKAPDARKARAKEGLLKILGRDAESAERELSEAHEKLEEHLEETRKREEAS